MGFNESGVAEYHLRLETSLIEGGTAVECDARELLKASELDTVEVDISFKKSLVKVSTCSESRFPEPCLHEEP